MKKLIIMVKRASGIKTKFLIPERVNYNKAKCLIILAAIIFLQPSAFGNLMLPEHKGQVDVSNRDNYLENALISNGEAQRFSKMPVYVFTPEGPYASLARRALKQWQDASGGVLSFVTAANEKDAQIIIKFSESAIGEMNKAFYAGVTNTTRKSDGSLQQARVKIVTKRNNQPIPEAIIYSVLLHELGHAVGIAGHSNNSADIMSTGGSEIKSAISARDIKTVKLLYSKTDFTQDKAIYRSAKYQQIKQMLEKTPDDYIGWAELGDFYFNEGYNSNAYKCYEYLTRLRPNEAFGWSRLGLYYTKQKDFDKAYVNLKTAHIKKPSDPIYMYDLAALCHNHNKKDMARSYLATFLKNYPAQRQNKTLAEIIKSYGV